MKLEKFEGTTLKKNDLLKVEGGNVTTTTVMIQTGYTENEYPDDGQGKPNFDCEPIVIDVPFPCPTPKK
jgi:hypothetical protein